MPDIVRPEVLPTLAELEAIVAANMGRFIACANALMQIKDRQLYKATHQKWDAYCWERWQISPSAANRRIEQGRVAAALPAGARLPSQRSLARDRQNDAHPTRIVPVTSIDTTEPRSPTTSLTPVEPQPVSALPIATDNTPAERFAKAVAALRIFPVDVAARLASPRLYADVMEWALGFRTAYQAQHPAGTAILDARARRDVTPTFKQPKK